MPRRKRQSETSHPTAVELDERVLACRRLLSEGRYDGEVKRQVAADFNLSPRTVERYLRRARDEMVAETGREPSEHRIDSYSFYRELRGNADLATRDRLKAQERIDKLLGLEAPTKLQHGADPDNPLPVDILRMVVPAESESKPTNGHAPASGARRLL
jgi:hypothetical protein